MKYRDQGKVYLGKTKDGDACYLTQHKWDCGWYWAFGYIGNSQWHGHISSMIDHPDKYDPDWTDVTTHFKSTWITQKQWWIIRDLFIQAYALKKAAETYKYGGHQTEPSPLVRRFRTRSGKAPRSHLGLHMRGARHAHGGNGTR